MSLFNVIGHFKPVKAYNNHIFSHAKFQKTFWLLVTWLNENGDFSATFSRSIFEHESHGLNELFKSRRKHGKHRNGAITDGGGYMGRLKARNYTKI